MKNIPYRCWAPLEKAFFEAFFAVFFENNLKRSSHIWRRSRLAKRDKLKRNKNNYIWNVGSCLCNLLKWNEGRVGRGVVLGRDVAKEKKWKSGIKNEKKNCISTYLLGISKNLFVLINTFQKRKWICKKIKTRTKKA